MCCLKAVKDAEIRPNKRILIATRNLKAEIKVRQTAMAISKGMPNGSINGRQRTTSAKP